MEHIRIIEGVIDTKRRDLYARADALRKWFQEEESRYEIPEVQFEYFALVVMGNEHINKGEGWPGYFQPFMQMVGSENPGYGLATPEALAYWQQRSIDCQIPILRARYSDLVIDFSKRLSGKGAHNKMRERYTNAVLDVVNLTTKDNWFETQTLLRRAINHARNLKAPSIWKSLANAVLHIDQIMKAEHGHLPTFSLELLSHEHLEFTKAQQETILTKFENALELSTDEEKSHFWCAQQALGHLAKHFKSDEFKTKRLAYIRKLEAYTAHHECQESGMRADIQWEFVQNSYEAEGSNDGINRALAHRKRIAPRTSADLKPVRHEFSIDQEPMEKLLNQLCEGEPGMVLVRFCDFHCPPKGGYAAFKKSMTAENSFMDFITEVKMDGTGRPVTRTVANNLDDEAKKIRSLYQYIIYNPLLLLMHIDRLKTYDWFNANFVANFIFRSNQIGRDNLMIEAIQFYFQNVHSAFLHIAIPRIESIIREECNRLGAPTTRPNKTGGVDHRLLNELLKEKALESTFHPEFLLYLRTLLTEKHGVNLRNNLLHGITSAKATSESLAQTSHRIFHALCAIIFYIQIERLKTSEQPSSPEEE